MSNSRSHSAACRVSRTRTATAPAVRSRPDLAANFVATNAYLAANSNLGRLLSGTTAATQNTTLQIINPDALYLDRDNQIDFRVGKVLKWRGMRSTVNLDLYNLTNASTIFTANQAYTLTGNVWLTPTSISNPRLMKISFTVDLK